MNPYKTYKYNPFSREDIDEIKNVIDYARGLVIMDKDKADSLETTTSLKNANLYLSAVNMTIKDITSYERNKLIKEYKETNPYYKELYDKYGIDYNISRTSKNFHILKSTLNTLDREDVILFERCYYDSLRYHLLVTFTDAFKNQKFDRSFQESLLIFMTIQRYITKKMENYFNIDTYDRKKLKNSFISNGLDYFDELPLNYQRRLLKMLNQLIQYKGTNKALIDILNIFGFDNIKIYKYILCKVNSNPSLAEDNELVFYRVPIEEQLDFDKNLSLTYSSIVEGDPYWRHTKEEILNEKFNTLNTKYMSADICIDIIKESLSMSYFLSLLNKMETECKEKQDFDFKFSNKIISDQPIDLMDAIIALISISIRSHGYKDLINKKINSVNYIYGYNNINDNVDINELLEEISILLIQNKSIIGNNEYEILRKFFNYFKMKNFNEIIESDYEELEKDFNSSSIYRRQLEKVCELSLNENIMYKFDNEQLFEVLDYITKRTLDDSKFDFMLFEPYVDIYKIYKRFINLGLNTKRYELKDFIYIMEINDIIMKQIDEIVSCLKDDTLLKIYNDYKDKTIDLIYVLEKINDLVFKKREKMFLEFKTDEERILYQKKDPQDIRHYPEFFTFTDLFLTNDTTIKGKYTMEDFIKIFKYNEKMRTTLEDFIVETNNIDLYRKFLKVWDIKFIGDINIEFFNEFNTYSDYLKFKDYNLFEFIDMPATIKGNLEQEYQFYRDRIFTLCESIDNHINEGSLNFFLTNNFIGMLDYVKRYIYILMHVFKAYTIDLLQTNTVLTIDDKTFNSVRLFDDYNIDIKLKFEDRIDIVEHMIYWSSLTFSDNIELNDNVNKTIEG